VKKIKHIILLLLVSSAISFSQKLNLQKFSVKNGLGQSTVKQIEEGNYGNLWLATNYGLSKFNGKNFENFTNSDGLPSNEISCILFRQSNLFIGTSNGFCSFSGQKIENKSIYKKIAGSIIKILEKDTILHIITTKGYYLLNLKNPSYSIDSISIPNIIVHYPTDAEFDEDGNIWISTMNKGLFYIQKNYSTKIPKFVLIQNAVSSTTINKKLVRIVNFNSTNLFKSNLINSIEFDKNNNLLISDWNKGLAEIKFNLQDNKPFEANYFVFNAIIPDVNNITRFVNIGKNENGDLFLATDKYGFLKVELDQNIQENDFNQKNIIWVSSNTGFYGNNPLCFKEDKFQNLWVGTLNDGLISVSNKSSSSYNKDLGLLEEKVISVYKSNDSSLWIGTHGGGAFKFKNKAFTRCYFDQKLNEPIIKSIVQDNNSNILLGTYGGGINIISKSDVSNTLTVSKTITTINKLSSDYISCLVKASDGAIWIGYQSCSKIDKLILNKDLSFSITTYTTSNNFAVNTNCLAEDDDKNIWLASTDGVYMINQKTGFVTSKYSSIKHVQTIVKDWNGNMWLGRSDAGIIILKNKLKVSYFENGNSNYYEGITTKNGISSNCVNSIIFTKNAIWVITNNAINEIKFDSYLNKIRNIKAYNKGKDFASYDNKPNTSILDDDGFIWVGSIDGLTQYQNINAFEENETKKEITVFITNILLENKGVNWADSSLFNSGEYSDVSFDSYFNWYKMPNNLKLDYTHSSITFILSTDNIFEQKQINYSYKLIGYDDQWIQIYSSNEINYRNLPAGEYELHYKASTTTDFSTAKEFTYKFIVTPPFWKTTLFYVLIAVAFILLFYLLITYRERKLNRDKARLTLQVKARTSEIQKQNLLIQGINNDLTDSIKYAKRIQRTILPNPDILENYFQEHFIFYKPRNIVSGDYYWIKELNGNIYVAVVDCTGHGVPGAFMSLISSSILNEAVEYENSHGDPVKILEYLRQEIKIRLNQNSREQINDGLDISLICYNKQDSIVEYVNANRPLYIISNDNLNTIQSQHVHIGGYAGLENNIHKETTSIKRGDIMYLFTDGITDQFGGEKNKKFNPMRLRLFLLTNNHLPLAELKQKLETEIIAWQGSHDQTDDILLMALKV
jgi:serine phosphatase RsbU (regulator of sigma subunit)/ligand-binding sensor domain-containing protein